MARSNVSNILWLLSIAKNMDSKYEYGKNTRLQQHNGKRK